MRILLVFIISMLLAVGIVANPNFTKMASGKPELVQQGKEKKWCPVCGMSIKKFYKTSHIAYTKDGLPMQYCSIRCLVIDTQKGKVDTKQAKVVDIKSEKYISVHDAFYVVGSKVPGTMSKVSKLAFASKDDALKFIEKMGGKLATFEEAYKMALKSLDGDIAMINKKRAKMMYPMGKKLLKARCKLIDKLDLFAFSHINELKPIINENCKNLKEKQAQAIALYLWDVKRFEKKHEHKKITVGDDERCPVCAMFVKKYPRWVAQIVYNGGHVSFDGVKDMIKYLHNPLKYGGNKDLKDDKILVTDYYSQLAIDGKQAFYVIGSDILGPMGHELIPFKKKSDADTFLKDHKGDKIIKLKDVTSSMICKLDGQVCE